jgi:hypothetical protein
MDESISISLRTMSGEERRLFPKRSITVRELLSVAHLPTPANASPLCLYHGSCLQLDLSLANQQIKDMSTIVVAFRRSAFAMRPPDRDHSGLLQEALRVSDMAFLELEASRHGSRLYKAMLADLESGSDEDDDPEAVNVLTVIDESSQGRRVAEAPLPPCWAPHAGANFDLT